MRSLELRVHSQYTQLFTGVKLGCVRVRSGEERSAASFGCLARKWSKEPCCGCGRCRAGRPHWSLARAERRPEGRSG